MVLAVPVENGFRQLEDLFEDALSLSAQGPKDHCFPLRVFKVSGHLIIGNNDCSFFILKDCSYERNIFPKTLSTVSKGWTATSMSKVFFPRLISPTPFIIIAGLLSKIPSVLAMPSLIANVL